MIDAPPPDDPDAAIGFEAALAELERIVAELEGGPDLASALTRYERGVRLLNRCQGLLDGAERSVALLTGVGPDGAAVTAPFDASATALAIAAIPAPSPAPTPAPPPPAPKAAAPAEPPPKPRKPKAASPPPTPTLPAWEPLLPDDPDNPGPPW